MAYTLNTPSKRVPRQQTHSRQATPCNTPPSQAGPSNTDLLREHADREQEAQRAAAAERRQFSEDRDNYRIYREALGDIHDSLLRDGIISGTRRDICLKRLGLLPQAKTEGLRAIELNVFMDYVCYAYCTNTTATAIDQYITKHEGTARGMDHLMLMALKTVEYTILRIHNVVAPGARRVVNLRTMQPHILRDEALARHEHEGVVLIGNILHFPNFIIANSASLPIAGNSTHTEFIQAFVAICNFIHNTPRHVRAERIGDVTKHLLQSGRADGVGTEDL